MRVEIVDIASGQAIHSEVTPTLDGDPPAKEIAEWVLQNQNVTDEPETIEVHVWSVNDMGDSNPDYVLEGKAA